MYKSTYLSVRIHTPEEALDIMPESNVDILLWLIDVYDLGQNETCARAVQKLIMKHYQILHERVPGMLPRWTKGMMAWVTFLNALEPCYEFDKEWVTQNNMLISTESPDMWTIDDLLTTLDAIAMRWKTRTRLRARSSSSTSTVCGLSQKGLQCTCTRTSRTA